MYYVGNIAELIAFIISLFMWRKNKDSFIEWMSPYLLYTFGNEMVAHYIHDVLHHPTTSLFLWYSVITTLFYTYIFKNLLRRLKKIKYVELIFWIVASIIALSFIFIFFFIANYVEYKYRLQIISYIYLCVLAAFYLYNEFTNDSLDNLLIYKSGFWIAAGILLFYSAMSVVMALHPTAFKNNILIFGLPIHLFFANILSVILYTCLSVAMIVWKPLHK